jgi:hypothetical protein
MAVTRNWRLETGDLKLETRSSLVQVSWFVVMLCIMTVV